MGKASPPDGQSVWKKDSFVKTFMKVSDVAFLVDVYVRLPELTRKPVEQLIEAFRVGVRLDKCSDFHGFDDLFRACFISPPALACSATAREAYGARSRAYETDLFDESWRLVRGFLPEDPGGGRPRSVCLRAVADAVFYVLRSGCAWRMIPADFPPWPTVYRHFRRWEAAGCIERIHDLCRGVVRLREGRSPEPSAGIIDSQTAKSSPQAIDLVGSDGGKKIKGRKRHIVVDTLGMLIGLRVHPADVQDRDGCALVFQQMEGQHSLLDVVFADGGYQGPRAAAGCPADLVVVKRTEPGFKVLPKRWLVERTFA